MSMNFHANQFDREFKAHRLGNWEVPRVALPGRPDPKRHPSHVIRRAQDRPGVGIGRPSVNYSSGFKNTWSLPNRITREEANRINGLAARKVSKWQQQTLKEIEPLKFPEITETDGKKDVVPDIKLERETVPERANELKPIVYSEEPKYEFKELNEYRPPLLYKRDDILDEEVDINKKYIPGVLTDPKHRHESYELLLNQHKDELEQEKQLAEEQDELLRKIELDDYHLEDNELFKLPKMHQCKKHHTRSNMVPKPEYISYQFARKLHRDNLEHQPLPDTVTDKMYRKLQMQGAENPGIELDIKPYSTGVAWRGYGAPGPTQCSKLRIYRPRTCGVVPTSEEEYQNGNGKSRPKTSVDKKRLQRQMNVTAMDLALKWDIRLSDPRLEPKRPVHIDGSNDSAGPAVFQIVHTPREADEAIETGRSNAIFTKNEPPSDNYKDIYFERDLVARKKLNDKIDGTGLCKHCTNKEQSKVVQSNYSRKSSGSSKSSKKCTNGNCTPEGSKVRPKTAWEKENNRNIENADHKFENCKHIRRKSLDGRKHSDNSDQNIKAMKKRYESSPNLSEMDSQDGQSRNSHKSKSSHNSNACNNNNNNCNHDSSKPKAVHQYCPVCPAKEVIPKFMKQPKSEYKMAFKAGKPQHSANSSSFDSTSSCKSSGSLKFAGDVKVPKPREPFARRTYAIQTLTPPFSLFRGGGGQGGYPEHWRLASVYQHTYKPIDSRKRPMLNTVYK